MEEQELTWRKSSRSGTNGGGCVEVATVRGAVMVRDSKDPHGPIMAVTPGDWRRFVAAVCR